MAVGADRIVYHALSRGSPSQGHVKVQVQRVQNEAYFDGVKSHYTVTGQAMPMALLKN